MTLIRRTWQVPMCTYVVVRHSEGGPSLILLPSVWRTFLEAVKAGEFDQPQEQVKDLPEAA